MNTTPRWYWCSGCERFIRRTPHRDRAWINSYCERAGRTVRLTLRQNRPTTQAEADARNASQEHGR